eukprot:TRINITY_DN36357_c0_g1_i1.p1 TRINITY_DN36357_c0_g1~~TRINITY_DN36357_c0_g1_i1.p1  ORF type:complete len:468 (+),score=83.87 TRINITY_DN36357_c0_g1_i1:81-1484(+)
MAPRSPSPGPGRSSKTADLIASPLEALLIVKAAHLSTRPVPKPKAAPSVKKCKKVDKHLAEKVKAIFRQFDLDGNGQLEMWEFKRILHDLDPDMFTDAYVTRVFAAADLDKNEMIDFEELLDWIFSDDDDAVEFRSATMPPSWEERLTRLAAHVCSSSVKPKGSAALEEIPASLSADEVENVFCEHVPGVKDFLFRAQEGQRSIEFIKNAYASGLRAYSETDLHQYFMWLLRLVVNESHDGNAAAVKHLRDIAEAFMDCQAVQARVIERAGLQLQGLRPDFLGQVIQLVGEYKVMALRQLSYQGCVKLGGPDESKDPAHFENRLLMDIGARVGFSDADVKRASLDKHATDRFTAHTAKECNDLVKSFRKLFDSDALLKALVSELNSFSETSPPESMPRLFLTWADDWMTQKFVILDEETCTQVDLADALGLVVLEVLFFGRPACPRNEMYRDERLYNLMSRASSVSK